MPGHRYERRKPYRRFKDISISERILNTVFLLTIGLGYIAALANLYYTHQGLAQPILAGFDALCNGIGSRPCGWRDHTHFSTGITHSLIWYRFHLVFYRQNLFAV